MPKRKASRTNRPRKPKRAGQEARAGRRTLRSEKVGVLPILNHFLRRLRLEELLQEHLPPEDKRVKVPASKALLVLLRNLLVSREPFYGIGEWAAGYAPDLLGLTLDELEALNDDGVGRALGWLFRSEPGALVLAVVQHTLREFQVTLHELHNDSTTITFHGMYEDAEEDKEFRLALRQGKVSWRTIHEKVDEEDPRQKVLDRFSVAHEPATSAEGYRLLWYHSTRKAKLDASIRAARIQRATRELDELRQRLILPRTRYRQRSKVAEAVEESLASREVKDWVSVTIEERFEERYRQVGRGRPTNDTRYAREVSQRFDLRYHIDHARIAEDQRCDGVFPRVTNVLDLSEGEVLLVYKRQPPIEKRFSQLKTDFRVAPVYLKDVSRIQAMLCVYFLVLILEALLEGELRQAMEREGIESLPLYPEDRPCRRPTARRVIDLFDDIHRHTLRHDGSQASTVFVTELSDLQRRILKLLSVPATDYQT